MDNLLDQLSNDFDESFSIVSFLIYILVCSGLLYILSILYTNYGKSISNRSQLSKVLILVGITTFIIISIVKSSLALSLGLVGALSIVRFRTAIKEPEELGYFFIAISIGLGLGASQLLPTIIGFVILALVIVVLSKNNFNSSLSQNLIIYVSGSKINVDDLVGQINSVISSNSIQVDLKRLKTNQNEINLNFLVNVTSFDKLKLINDSLLNIDENIDVTFIDSEI